MTLVFAHYIENSFEMYADVNSSLGSGEVVSDSSEKIFDLPAVIIGTLGSADDMYRFLFNRKKLDPLEFKKILIKNIQENLIPLGIQLIVFFKDTAELWIYTADEDGDIQAHRHRGKFLAMGCGSEIAKALQPCPPSQVFSVVHEIYPIISTKFTFVTYDKKETKPRRKKAD